MNSVKPTPPADNVYRALPKQKDRRIRYIPVDEIAPNPMQPRIEFDDASLDALSESIRRYGFIQPITVKKRPVKSITVNGQTVSTEKYELVSGERRYRAARRIGLKTVPCILMTVDVSSSALIALTENLQREDLNFFEEASAIHNLLIITGATQSALARQLSISQSALANKLRLLALSDDEKKQILSNSLTERHARAFIRIKDPSVRARMIDRAVKKNLSAAECENEISALLAEKEKPPAPSPKPKRISLVRDINFFLNSVNRAVSLFSESGVQIKKETKDLGDCIEIVLNVKKA